MAQPYPPIPGTTLFDGGQARKGYALNKMCFSFNSAENRAEFQKDEEAYMRKYGLTEAQKAAIRSRQVLHGHSNGSWTTPARTGARWTSRSTSGSDRGRIGIGAAAPDHTRP